MRLPKTDSAQDVTDMAREISRIESECGREVGSTGLLAAIESANRYYQALAIAQASPRLMALIVRTQKRQHLQL